MHLLPQHHRQGPCRNMLPAVLTHISNHQPPTWKWQIDFQRIKMNGCEAGPRL